ncbi:MAG: DegV family protein [Syntrophomonadaceae bacterium]|nr:DegV family protein [Syntrophomonadaceae bacterium]
MNNYRIMTDSSCDLPASMVEELGITVVPLSVLLKGAVYKNYLDEREISFHDFYELLRQKNTATTSAVNTYDFTQAMEQLLQEGQDILYLGFSSALSATCSAAVTAADELREKYPERRICTVDTLCASLGQGMLVYLTAQEQRRGSTLEEARAFAENMKLKICHWFTVDDLQHLKRGGRLSAASAALGTVLNIKPILRVDNEGRLISVEKTRGRSHAIKLLARKASEKAKNLSQQTVFINHGDCEDDAQRLKNLMVEAGVKDIVINQVGMVIGAHTGPGVLSVYFVGEERA